MRPACCLAATILAIGPGLARSDQGSTLDWSPVDSAVLAEQRGGFDGMLQLSFGMERAVYVNGELVTRTEVEIPDIRNMTVEQATALDQAANAVVVIQNGPNNIVDIGSIAPGTTVIQNTLNDQHIVSLTALSVDANTLAMFQGLNTGESLQQSLNTVAGVR